MSLRDQFAREAMNGMLSNANPMSSSMSYEQVAHASYNMADAMIAERNSRSPNKPKNEALQEAS